jgi:ribosomal protein RSM22 (predicted rRNA methylase)
VTAAYAVAELPTAEQRVAVTALLWRLVAPGGALVVIEHGDARGSHVVRSMRQVYCNITYFNVISVALICNCALAVSGHIRVCMYVLAASCHNSSSCIASAHSSRYAHSHQHLYTIAY